MISSANTKRPLTAAATAAWDTSHAKNLALALLVVTQVVIVIDGSIVNVALPSIGAHLNFSREGLSWVINAYVLTFGGFLVLGGRLADLLGRRRMFMLGLAVFSVASLPRGWRSQRVGCSSDAHRALGIWGAATGAGGSAGGVLTSGLGWRSALLLSSPPATAGATQRPRAASRPSRP